MARRVNTKFLVIFSVIVLGGVASAFIVAGPLKTMIRGDRTKKLIESGDAAMKAAEEAESAQVKREKLDGAVRDYEQAVVADGRNPELLVKLGDAYTKLTQYDVHTYIGKSRAQWGRALELDPTHLPALRRLQDSYYAEAKIGYAEARFFTLLREKAEAIRRLDPKDLRAQSLVYIAPLNQWLANIETPPDQIDIAVAELGQLIAKHPDAPEVPDMAFFLAGAKAKRGVELKRGGQERQGNDQLAQAVQVFQEALKQQPANAELNYRFYELLKYVRSNDLERDNTQRYTETMRAALDRARELVKPEDAATFVKVYLAAHYVAIDQRNPKKAEQILLDLYNARPTDQRVRLALAKLWRFDRAKQDEAVRLLREPMVDGGWEGVEAKLKLDLEVQSLTELATMLIERYGQAKEAEKAEAMAEITATYDRIFSKVRERSYVLKLRGRIELLKGGPDANVRAIQTFEKAQAQYAVEWNGKEDLELTYLLARAYFNSRQTGQAKMQLLKHRQRQPDFPPVRMMLAQVLIAEGDVAAAREDVDYLEKHAPDDADVIRLKLAVLDPAKEQAKVPGYFQKLPEQTRPQQLSKAMVATLAPVSNPDEALRLYKQVLAADAGDFDALQGAKEVLLKQGKKDEAVSLLKAGEAAAKPDVAQKISLVLQQIQGASADEIVAASEKLIREQFKDKPFELALKLYDFNLIRQDRARAFGHLQEAERLKPDDGKVADLMFQHYLGERQWDKAAWYVDQSLAPKNWDQANGLIYRFRLAMVKGDLPQATAHARELTTRLKEFARSWVFLGQALQASKQYQDAISTYSVALDKQSENPEAIAGTIACYLALNRASEAGQYIERGRRAHPNNPYFREQWKQYQMQFGDPAAVIKPLLDERDANPKDPNRWLAVGQAQYAAARKGGKDAAKHGADAKATLTEAVKQWPGERLGWALLVDLATFNKDAAGAEALLKDMAARPEFKDSAEPAMMLADHYLRQNNTQQAEAVMKQTVDRHKANVDVRRRLAAYYTQSKRYDEALKLLDPASPDKLVRQQIVEIHMLSGNFGQAENLLRGLLSATPDDPQLHALLGVVLSQQNKPEQAVEALSAALKLDATNAAALFSRGQMRLRGKTPQLDEAIQDLTALVSAHPRHVEGRVLLADALRQRGRAEESTRELTVALEQAPQRRDVRVALIAAFANPKAPSWGEAERLITQAKALEPKDAVWPRMQANLHSSRGQHDRAVEEIRAAMALDRQNGELVRDYFNILEAGKFHPQLLVETNNLIASDKQIAEKGWWVYVKRAVAQRYSDRKAEAVADFVKAMEIAQADKDASQDVLIAIIDKIKETLGPEAAIDRVLALVRTSKGAGATRWKVVLAYLYFQNKDVATASSMIEEARREAGQMDPRGQVTMLNVAGTIYMLSNQYDRARGVYEELLAKQADDVGALNNLACVMAEHVKPPNLPKALELAQRAYDAMAKRDVMDANVLDTLGWVNVLAGGPNLDRGIEHLTNSIKVGEIPEAHYHLGEAYMRKNFPDGAVRSFKRAAEMLAERKAAGPIDEGLQQKVDEALARVNKALSEPRAGTP
jgi:predicted Zn-dependent protease